MRVCCSEVKGHKGQPDDAGGVHGETNVLCLIEVLRNFSCFDGVNCANSDQDHAVHLDTDELLNIKCSSSIVKKRVASPQFYATCTHFIKENFGTRKILLCVFKRRKNLTKTTFSSNWFYLGDDKCRVIDVALEDDLVPCWIIVLYICDNDKMKLLAKFNGR